MQSEQLSQYKRRDQRLDTKVLVELVTASL